MDGIEPSDELVEKTRRLMDAQLRSGEEKKRRRVRLLAIPAVALAAAAVIFAILWPAHSVSGFSADSLTIEPTSQVDGVVGVDTGFLITSDSGRLPSKSAMKELITILPETDFELEKKEGGYLLTTGGNFDEGSLIRLTVSSADGSEKRWTFQTGEKFRLKKHFPADGAEYVDCSVGIEMEFTSADVTEEDFRRAFSITPETKGSIVKRGGAFTFIPDEPLHGTTEYTVAIDGGLAAGDETLGETVSFSFTTASTEGLSGEKGVMYSWKQLSENYLPEDIPTIEYYTFGDISDEDVRVEVWRYEDDEAYKKALKEYAAAESAGKTPEIRTEGLAQAMSFSTDTNLNGDYHKYAVFPERLEKGWYVARVTAMDGYGGEECSIVRFIQVSDVSVYALETDDNSLFWLNSAADGEPLASAEITVERGDAKIQGTTGADGVAYVERLDGGAKTGVLDIVSSAGRYLSLWSFIDENNSVNEKYFSYIYPDRPIYRTDDTVGFWGVVFPRDGQALPQTVRVTLGNWDNAFCTKEIAIGKDGAFQGEISFTGLTGGLTLSVELDGEVAYSRYVEAYDYDKPVYSVDVKLDKAACFIGDSVTADVSVSFFDGTPAAGTALEVSIDGSSSGAVRVVTDKYGRASVALTASVKDSEDWRPSMYGVTAMVSGAEDELTEGQAQLWVCSRDVALYGDFDGERRRLDVFTESVELSELTGDLTELYKDNCAIIRGGAAEKKVYGYLYRVWYTKVETGSYYDQALRRTVKSYDYRRNEERIKTYKFETAGGTDYIDGIPTAAEGESYYVLLSTTDSQGRNVSFTVQIGSDFEGYRNNGRYFHYERSDGGEQYTFTDGEAVELTLKDNNDSIEGGRLLSIVATSRADEYQVTGTRVTIPYSEKRVPNFIVYGAWFDGKRVYSVDYKYMSLDTSQRELKIELDAGGKYKPGEDAVISVKATDKDGRAAANAAGVVMLVDEAVFAIRDQEPYALDALYRGVYFNSGWATYVSYNDYMTRTGEGGEGGGGSGLIRKNFRDTAGIYSFTTDANGRASVKVKLPDNVTSWRATVIVAGKAVDGRLLAEDARTSVASGLDFFVSQIMPKELLEGDELHVTLRSGGDALGDRSHTVEYVCELKSSGRVSLSEPGADMTLKTSGAAGDYVDLNFGKLPVGEYTVTITARCGKLADGLELPLTVLGSAVEAPVARAVALGDIAELKAGKYPIRLCVYRAGDRLLERILSESVMSAGSRADQRLARAWASGDVSGVAGLTGSNGISMYPYADKDPMLTAQLLAALGEQLEFSDMSDYFRSVLSNVNSTSDEVAAAYLGLAAEGQPVLADIRSLLADEKSFTLYDRMILTAALAVIGDDDGAQTSFESLTQGIVVTARNAAGFDESRVAVAGFSEEETLRLTAAASITASLLHNGREDAFAEYLASHSSRSDLTLSALLCYMTHLAPSKESAKLTYVMDGEVRTAKLDGENRMLFLSVTREQQQKLQLKCVSGSVLATAYYYGGVEELLKQQPSDLTVNKSYSASGGYSVGDKANVVITVSGSALGGGRGLVVADYLPAGMRFFALDKSSEAAGWHVELEEGQRVRFVWYPAEPNDTVTPLSYTAVCVSSGSYISERAYAGVSGSQPSLGWGLSERGSVAIAERLPADGR